MARAFGTGGLALVALFAGGVMFAYRGDSGLPLAIVFLTIGILLLGYALFCVFRSRQVGAYKLQCPMCNAVNSFEAAPNEDVICRDCHRRIPIEGGKILPLQQISCGDCNESNWYSDRTKNLLCESCGREIAIARPDGNSSPMYAVNDDARPYDLVLIAYEPGHDDLAAALQELLGCNRAQIRSILTDLPSVLLSGVPRQKAEIVRGELMRYGAALETRPAA